MSKPRTQKNPTWFYVVLAVQALFIILIIGMLKDLMWIF